MVTYCVDYHSSFRQVLRKQEVQWRLPLFKIIAGIYRNLYRTVWDQSHSISSFTVTCRIMLRVGIVLSDMKTDVAINLMLVHWK